jgi:pSer/pThr/pTyr-binding forkhead associated (FHA) protein
MTIKNWVLGRVQKTGGLFARSDLPRSEPGMPTGGRPPQQEAAARPADGASPPVEHLGFYAALVGAIRDELEHFVASHVRLHLAIADHDRFLLTSIHVSCADSAEARRLLHQFMHEFRPEQVKRYLAREVIGALPNAAAIDLTQFAGLLDADAQGESEADSEYGELLAALRTATPAPTTRAYRVSIVGRWTERDGATRTSASPNATSGATPTTPMTGQRCDFDIEDADGRRRVVLHGVTAGRRYLIGKDAGCDIRVNGTYTSRRHSEIWMDRGAWHVTDAGSTNGIRVESAAGVERCMPWVGDKAAADASPMAIALGSGARIVLSAHAEGPAADYPSLSLRSSLSDVASRVTPIAGGMAAPNVAASKTPLTPIHSARQAELVVTLRGAAGGPRTLTLSATALPVTVGRSRNQSIVIGRAHELVSGHHLDIVSVDEHGAQVLVHGDNGVVVDGTHFAAGARLTWKTGQAMVLGAAPPDGSACTLMLSRRDD